MTLKFGRRGKLSEGGVHLTETARRSERRRHEARGRDWRERGAALSRRWSHARKKNAVARADRMKISSDLTSSKDYE